MTAYCQDTAAVDRRVVPLLLPQEVAAPSQASQLSVERCDPQLARRFIAAWHSRLPKTQAGPWIIAFVASYEGTAFGAALWHNPSARTLPKEWLELRRLAVAPDAPHCTASRMLGQMKRWIKTHMPTVERLISYQDIEVHKGTIYKAAGWTPTHLAKARTRDRSKVRVGTSRMYRSNLNGQVPDSAAKMRWERSL
jgi:hypothetical protein